MLMRMSNEHCRVFCPPCWSLLTPGAQGGFMDVPKLPMHVYKWKQGQPNLSFKHDWPASSRRGDMFRVKILSLFILRVIEAKGSL